MDRNEATKCFGALSLGTRLEVFRLLVRIGAGGLAAGDIARTLEVPQNTMSSHLAIMVNAGLLESRREGRSIIYSVNLNGTLALLTFLLEDCCQGQPGACTSLLKTALPDCIRPQNGTSA